MYLRRMLKITWAARKSSETVLRKVNMTRSLINLQNSKSQVNFLSHLIRRGKLEHLESTGWNDRGKCSRGKQLEKMLDGLTKRLKLERVTEALKASMDRDAWKVIKSTAPD